LKDGLPEEPLAAKLRLGFYLGPTIEREVEISTFETLRRMESTGQVKIEGGPCDAGEEAQSPAEKLRGVAQRREREATEKQGSQGRREALERATLDAAPGEFKALAELLRTRGESLNAEHLPGSSEPFVGSVSTS